MRGLLFLSAVLVAVVTGCTRPKPASFILTGTDGPFTNGFVQVTGDGVKLKWDTANAVPSWRASELDSLSPHWRTNYPGQIETNNPVYCAPPAMDTSKAIPASVNLYDTNSLVPYLRAHNLTVPLYFPWATNR